MTEGLRVLDERYLQSNPPASREVRDFLSQNPTPSSSELLAFTLEYFPQRKRGKVEWLVEGSKAVELYHPGEIEPKDFDILAGSEEFVENFGSPPGHFDIRDVGFWLRVRNEPDTKSNRDYLMSAHMSRVFENRFVLVSAPNVLGFSKYYTYGGKGPRPKDLLHLAIMAKSPTNVGLKHIERVHRRLKAA